MTRAGVLLMAYGAPQRLEQVEAYYTHIRGGTPPPPALLDELRARYRSIGGGSPLSRIVERQRAALAAELARRAHAIPVYAGMKHIRPFIGDVVRRMAEDGVERVVAIALAPQHSTFNEQTYGRAVTEAAASVAAPASAVLGLSCAPAPVTVRVPAAACHAPAVTVVGSWHDQPRLIDAFAAATAEAVARCSDPARAHVFFTAHSLPERASGGTDRYAREVAATAALVAERCGLERCGVAFQSAGRTADRWIGPDLGAEIGRVAATGVREVVVSPVGFVADHLEVLYDIDIEARRVATGLGVRLERARSLNDDPTFIAALADVATAALRQPVAA